MQCLGSIDQRLFGFGMKIRQHHVGAGNDALGRYMHYIEDVIGPDVATAYRMRRVNTHRQVSQVSYYRYVAEVHQITVWITHIGLHTTQAENNITITLAG